jgi:hypothetical protein
VQVPIVPHVEAAIALHTVPQDPQLLELVITLVSQPSSGLPLQSAKPALHEPTTHSPSRHSAIPLATAQQTPLHTTCPSGQVVTQDPARHVPVEQAVPSAFAGCEGTPFVQTSNEH